MIVNLTTIITVNTELLYYQFSQRGRLYMLSIVIDNTFILKEMKEVMVSEGLYPNMVMAYFY